MNKDNFEAWQELKKLHLATIIDLVLKYLNTKYKAPTRTLTMEDISKNKNHSIMMIDITSTLDV